MTHFDSWLVLHVTHLTYDLFDLWHVWLITHLTHDLFGSWLVWLMTCVTYEWLIRIVTCVTYPDLCDSWLCVNITHLTNSLCDPWPLWLVTLDLQCISNLVLILKSDTKLQTWYLPMSKCVWHANCWLVFNSLKLAVTWSLLWSKVTQAATFIVWWRHRFSSERSILTRPLSYWRWAWTQHV